MDLILSMHPMARAWLLDGPLSSYVGAFQALLERGRYAEGSSETALRAWSHFAHWMTKCQVSAEQIDEALVEQFLDSHLPRCDCHPAALRTRSGLSASLGQALAEYMRHERPATMLPSLFVRRLAPHDKPIGVDGVNVANKPCRYGRKQRPTANRWNQRNLVGTLLPSALIPCLSYSATLPSSLSQGSIAGIGLLPVPLTPT